MDRGAERTAAGAALLEQMEALPAAREAQEPSDLAGIRALAQGEACEKAAADFEKIYGAWLGRCAGCLLGQPVEGWRRARINGLLEETGNLPLKGYISSDIPAAVREKYGVRDDQHAYGAEKTGWINNVSYMPEDDDTNYTLLALNIGITVSTLANTQQTAMFISTSVFMLPTVLLSGMVFPIENMPRILQYLSEIVPAKWYIAALRDVMLKGGGVGLIAENIAVMAAMAIAFALASLARFKTRLE